MSTDPIRTIDYEQYMQARERQVRAEIMQENERLRELAHRLTFEVEMLKADLSRSESIRWNLQERLVTALAGYEQLEEVIND